METDVETAEEEEEVKQLFRLEEDWRGGGGGRLPQTEE
jgi:hypothetical protein